MKVGLIIVVGLQSRHHSLAFDASPKAVGLTSGPEMTPRL